MSNGKELLLNFFASYIDEIKNSDCFIDRIDMLELLLINANWSDLRFKFTYFPHFNECTMLDYLIFRYNILGGNKIRKQKLKIFVSIAEVFLKYNMQHVLESSMLEEAKIKLMQNTLLTTCDDKLNDIKKNIIDEFAKNGFIDCEDNNDNRMSCLVHSIDKESDKIRLSFASLREVRFTRPRNKVSCSKLYVTY
jgi:hypothetical protein